MLKIVACYLIMFVKVLLILLMTPVVIVGREFTDRSSGVQEGKDRDDIVLTNTLAEKNLDSGNFAWQLMDERISPKTRIQHLFDSCVANLIDVSKPGYKAFPMENVGSQNLELSDYYKKQGKLVDSDDAFTFAINGEGFFQVVDQSGNTYYTRNGVFIPDGPKGVLKNTDGHYLVPLLSIKNIQSDYSVTSDGKFHITKQGGVSEEIYEFKLYMPTQNAQVERYGSGFVLSEVRSVSIDEEHQILYKKLEISTADPLRVLVKMTKYLYLLQEEDPSVNTSLRLYLVDLLLKEYARSKVLISKTSLDNFIYLSQSFESSLLFSDDDSQSDFVRSGFDPVFSG